MPRAFKEIERQRIGAALLAGGERLFGTYGLRKTSVEEIARAAGISKGAFYLFYDSKETLFMAVLRGFEQRMREQVLALPQADGQRAAAWARAQVRLALRTWRESPLLRHFTNEDYTLIARQIPDQQASEHFDDDTAFGEQLLEAWRAAGLQPQVDAALFTGLMRSLFFVSLHEGDFAPDIYAASFDLLLDATMGRVLGEE